MLFKIFLILKNKSVLKNETLLNENSNYIYE